jgi:hypothetical protein
MRYGCTTMPDPYQMVNVVDQPAYVKIQTSLHEELVAWLDYIGYESGATQE